eukprot:767433-Hanusia_phi.AAC.3
MPEKYRSVAYLRIAFFSPSANQYTSPINTSLPSFVTKKTTRVREVQTCRLIKDPASFVLEVKRLYSLVGQMV